VRIFILGIRHQIQPAEIGSWSTGGKLEAFERGQKETFASLLQRSIAERGVKLTAEETIHGKDTVTKRVCASVKCLYANIEMPPEERSARGIPVGYNENPVTPQTDSEQWNREREDYMATQTIVQAGEADSVMVVCGWSHTQPLAERFQNAGHTVETADLRSQPWYIDDWQTHMMRL
jgi:hypothetical protein